MPHFGVVIFSYHDKLAPNDTSWLMPNNKSQDEDMHFNELTLAVFLSYFIIGETWF